MSTTDRTLPRAERLSGRTEIAALFAAREGGFVYPFRYVVAARAAGQSSALLISVGKKYHKRAVRRNLLKRRVREAFRLHKARLAGLRVPTALALIYCSKDILSYREIEDALLDILARVAKGAQAGAGPAAGAAD